MRYRNPLLSPNIFTVGHSSKIEGQVADLTAVGSPDRAEHAILGIILGIFWPIQANLVVEEPLCDLGIPS